MGRNTIAAAPLAQVVVGQGAEATVHLDRGKRSVTKIYRSADFEAARRAAAREYRLLGQVHEALREVPGLTSPRPIALDESPPSVCMEFHGGLPLAAHVARRRLGADEVARIARALARGLRAYVRATGEAYYDFSMQNVLVDDETCELVLVDFGMPLAQRSLHGRYPPMRMSVGNFLGWSIYELARPANLPARLARAQFFLVYRAMIDALFEAGDLGLDDLPQVETVARLTYRNLTALGSPLRRGWYRIAGLLWLPRALAQAHRGLKSAGRSSCAKSTFARSARATGCRTPTT
jgi:hypothetical protein